jgi:UDP-2,3-diacylglucosamine pyrophosphatase LpxH
MQDTIKELNSADAKELLNQVVNSKRRNNKVSWVGVQQQMQDYGYEGTKEKWRTMWRIENEPKTRMALVKGTKKRDDARVNRFEDEERLVAFVKSKRRITYVSEMLGLCENDILALAFRANLRGYNIKVWQEGDNTMMHNIPILETSDNMIKRLKTTNTIKVAIVSDTHMGSKFEAIDALKTFYEYAHSKGVLEFYHCGDISDGYYKTRDGSIYEQHCFGFDDQANYIAREYPKIDGCYTYFITGNHDASHIANGGANIGVAISRMRDDMVYLGHNYAKVWLSEGVDLDLTHPNDGATTAISYKAQRIVDTRTKKSKILAIGHYHKMAYLYYKNTHVLMCPSFQNQTIFMEGHNLTSYVGGYILTIQVDNNGDILSLTPEFVELGE